VEEHGAAHCAASEPGECVIEQIGLACTGAIAIFLAQDQREAWRRWACIFGLAGQPFWFYSTWKADQWGIFLLCLLYLASWFRGFWIYWAAPYLKERRRG
jgi:hypothetical protein